MRNYFFWKIGLQGEVYAQNKQFGEGLPNTAGSVYMESWVLKHLIKNSVWEVR
jgi:hypothetical protein